MHFKPKGADLANSTQELGEVVSVKGVVAYCL